MQAETNWNQPQRVRTNPKRRTPHWGLGLTPGEHTHPNLRGAEGSTPGCTSAPSWDGGQSPASWSHNPGKSVHLSLNLTFVMNRWKPPNPIAGQTQDTPLRPGVDPARPVGPGPVTPPGAAPSATPRPPHRTGKGLRFRNPARILLPPGGQLLILAGRGTPPRWPAPGSLVTCARGHSSQDPRRPRPRPLL